MKLIAELRHYRDVDGHDVHDHHQLIIGLSGKMDIQLEGNETLITAARGALVPAGARHDFVVDAPHSALIVDLGVDRAAWKEKGLVDVDRLFDAPLAFSADPVLQHLVGFAAGELPRHAPDSALAQQIAGTVLLTLAGRPLLDESSKSAPIDMVIIERFIDAHLEDKIRVADLARLAHRSESHFQVLFQKAAGDSVSSFVKKRRVHAAARLVTTTDRPLKDIALATGFPHQSALTHAMKEILGVTPGALRKK